MTIIRVVDLELTDFPPDGEPIEIGAIDIDVEPFALPKIAPTYMAQLVAPLRPIPPRSSAVHHLVDEDVAGALPWAGVMEHCYCWSTVDVYAAHSIQTERHYLTDALTGGRPWIDTYKCALRLWPDAPGHSNQVLRYWLKPPGLDRAKAMPPHRAGPDAYVTAHILAAQIELASVEQLIAWSGEPALLVRVPFGKDPPEGSRGMKWTEVDIGLLYWVVDRDFGDDILFTVRHEIARREKEAAAAAAAQDTVDDGNEYAETDE